MIARVREATHSLEEHLQFKHELFAIGRQASEPRIACSLLFSAKPSRFVQQVRIHISLRCERAESRWWRRAEPRH